MQQNKTTYGTTGTRIQQYHKRNKWTIPLIFTCTEKKKKNFKQNSSGFGYFLHKSMENIVLYDDFWLTKSLVNMCHDNI